ncbi:Conserved_hypothetical protein [Hexamita inflata]|uniref:Uncharacterized protein n=1 Tax=Hexamita inflata TaxID=28002 RepID=A0ABP1HGP9_9EUKA
MNVNTFSLFGFSLNSQTITESNINISIQFKVISGALLCITCDVDVNQCNLVFIASGQQISGMIIQPKYNVKILLSFIQFRISSMNSSGLTNIILQTSVTFIISQCKLIGSNLLQSSNNGYIASTVLVDILLNITQFDICVDGTSRFGHNSVIISTIGSESVQCDLCEQKFVVYGLCSEIIKYSENVNGMHQCVYPFEYDDNQCVCASGYLLNFTKCISILESLNAIGNLVSNSSNDQIKQLEQKIDIIENSLFVVDLSIASNISEIEKTILSNFSKSDKSLMLNTSVLDNRIYQNISSVKNDILMNQISADANLLINTTALDLRIFNNISYLQNMVNNFTLYYNDSLRKQQQTIEQQQNIIDNLTEQIHCLSNSGSIWVNGSCVQASCAILGQQRIKGICKCVNVNAIVQAGSCVCPVNSKEVGTACVCSISGQTIQNGQCACSTTGAFVESDSCTCGVNSINISNTCSCPSRASLVNGVCVCSDVNAYISGNQCICPAYSLLVGNTCTCPTNSQIVNNICTCNLITGQIMNNGVCECQALGAFINNGDCICPTDTSLVNNVCICDKISGQQVINGICQCVAGQSIVDNSCQYIINIQNIECSQQLFVQQFDIYSVTNLITSSNFSAGYVFSGTMIIENAFIDISDNVYSTTVYPLFQSQSTFTNLKIQFGTQSLNSGSLIMSSSSVSINQMNIISRPDSQLKVNSAEQFNILMSSSSATSISNLLLNLSFAPSNGNITLINNFENWFIIDGYQVLGTYISTGTVAMIALNINSATVDVFSVSIIPSAFNVGNGSSYLFGNAETMNQVGINNLSVIIGNSSNFLLLDSNSYQFGGVFACINRDSNINVSNVILDSYQNFSDINVNNSGLLFGQNLKLSSITIINVCMQQNITSNTQFVNFGLIGINYGSTSILNVSIAFSIQGDTGICFGIIGSQYDDSIYAEVVNLRASVSFVFRFGNQIGSLFGYESAQNCSIQNASVIEGNISISSQRHSDYGFGGFIGKQRINATIADSLIYQMNITGDRYTGGFVGYYSSGQLYLINSKMHLVRLSGSIVGLVSQTTQDYFPGTIYFTNSSSTQNYVNDLLQSDCADIISDTFGCMDI